MTMGGWDVETAMWGYHGNRADVGKTMPQTTHDWKWFVPPIKVVIWVIVDYCKWLFYPHS
jgi:hypothetical protein